MILNAKIMTVDLIDSVPFFIFVQRKRTTAHNTTSKNTSKMVAKTVYSCCRNIARFANASALPAAFIICTKPGMISSVLLTYIGMKW